MKVFSSALPQVVFSSCYPQHLFPFEEAFHVFGGQEDDRNRDLNIGGIAKNQSYGTNLMYRLGSNILTSIETSQVRTTYLGSGTRVSPHYDLAFAYLF